MALKKSKTDKVSKVGKGKKEKTKKIKTPSNSTIALITTFPFLRKMLYKGEKEQALNLAMAKKASPHKLPRVNLLPPEVNMKVTLRKTRFFLVLSVIAILLISVLTWLTQTFTITVAQQGLLAAQKEVAQSQTLINSYIPVQKFFDSLKARTTIANQKIGAQINYSSLLTSVKTAVGNTSTISNISTKLITAPAAGTKLTNSNSGASQCGPVDDPFATATTPLVACLTFDGTTTDRTQINAMTNRLAAVPFLSNVSITQTSQVGNTSNTSFTFSGTAAISNKILLPSSVVLK